MGGLRATAALEALMKRHVAKVNDLEARRRAEDEEVAREFAELEAQLKDSEGRADKAETKADALAEFRAELSPESCGPETLHLTRGGALT